MTQNFDWKKHLKEVMDRTEFLALSTSGKKDTWTCPVQFSYDEKLNFYFKSMPSSKHMQSIANKSEVSGAIFSTNRFPRGDVAGLQFAGKAVILTTQKDVEIAAKHHYERNKPYVNYKSKVEEHLGKNAIWNFVKIMPSEIWLFDTRCFDEESEGRQLVPKEVFK